MLRTEPAEVAKDVTAEIDKASIREHLAHLTGVSPASLGGGKKTIISERESESGRKAAAEYMRKSFEEAGVPARILEVSPGDAPRYGYINPGNKRGYNVEATLQGSEGEKHLWVTAHLDSVGNAGANDNASGLVLLLLSARALEGLDLKNTVHFVAYDLEESGKVGSIHYMESAVAPIKALQGEDAIIGNINNDMVGYEENEFNAVISGCEPTGSLDSALVDASRLVSPSVTLDQRCSPYLRYDSDHARFLNRGLPAVVVTDRAVDDYYPCYHKSCDTVDKVNVTYLRSMIELVATASAMLAVPESQQ
jgi:Peptidase family M28